MAGASKKEPSALTKEIASILRGWEARTQYGSGALAKTVGVSPAQMSKILAGQKQIDIELFEDMCIALGLNWIEILREAETAISEDRKRA